MPPLSPTSFAGTPQPEQTFFADPALDRLLGVTMALAAEVHILRNRLQALEQSATGRVGIETLHEDDADFVARLLAPLLGVQQAKGPL